MKSSALLLLFWGILAIAVRAQIYSIDWFTIAGGGGLSSGSVYSINGTIGQSAANGSPMAGGNYVLTGGFWVLTAVQTEGAPVLAISLANSAVMVFWPSTSTNWILQQDSSLNSTNWITVPEAITNNGNLEFIIVSPPAGNRFYRLVQLP
jgi:hypothetical protein